MKPLIESTFFDAGIFALNAGLVIEAQNLPNLDFKPSAFGSCF